MGGNVAFRVLGAAALVAAGVGFGVWTRGEGEGSLSMTLSASASASAAAAPVLASALSSSSGSGDRVFEMRIYHTENEKMAEAMHARFRDHTRRLFRKHGMELVGFWVPREEKTKLVYILAHASREAADESWRNFREDPEWQRVRRESHEKAGGEIVSKVESIFMDPTDYSDIR